MLTLYYSPGASSVIPHITLEEIRVPYQRKLINLAKGEHKTDAYLKINPHGKVPALCVDGNVLTENVAILTYLAKQFSDARLLPQNLLEEARCLSTMAWYAATLRGPKSARGGGGQSQRYKCMGWTLLSSRAPWISDQRTRHKTPVSFCPKARLSSIPC